MAALASACAGSDAAPAPESSVEPSVAEPDRTGVEARSQIGPRAIDTDRAMLMVVDSIDASGDDVKVRIRVANLSDRPLDVGSDETRYGPLVTLADDVGNTYPALAVEPAGIYSRSIGRFDIRLEGPLDPHATELTLELSSQRGPLATDPFPAFDGAAVQWWNESPALPFRDLSATGQDGRTVRVLDIADRGTHLEISFAANDPSSGFEVDDARATLALADGTTLESLAPASATARPVPAMTGVLRFPGTLPIGSEPLVLSVAGIDVEIPAARWPSTSERLVAGLAQLPDLIHAKIFNDPLPTSSIAFGAP